MDSDALSICSTNECMNGDEWMEYYSGYSDDEYDCCENHVKNIMMHVKIVILK